MLAATPQYINVSYQAHCQDIGWQSWKSNSVMVGTTGQVRQMEAIKIKVTGGIEGILHQAHCQNIGWQSWKSNGAVAGTTGQALQMEAIRTKLTGQLANIYDVVYRVHVSNIGWQSWKSNGAMAGTTGQALQIEAIQIKLVAKAHPKIPLITAPLKIVSKEKAVSSRLYFMIDETGSKYLVSVTFDKNGEIVSYCPWLLPIDKN